MLLSCVIKKGGYVNKLSSKVEILTSFNQPTTAQRCRSETGKNISGNLFSSALLQLKKYHVSGNLKFNNSDIFLSLKLHCSMGKILRISLKLFTPNTLGCYGLTLMELQNVEKTKKGLIKALSS